MTVNERIRELRKKYLHMNQTIFAQKIGMKQTSISSLEKPGAAVTKQTLRLICSVFNVNEEWILNGTEPMFVQPETFSLDKFATEHHMSDRELRILKLYLELDPQVRNDAIDYFMKGLSSSDTTTSSMPPQTVEELEEQFPPQKTPPNRVS